MSDVLNLPDFIVSSETRSLGWSTKSSDQMEDARGKITFEVQANTAI